MAQWTTSGGGQAATNLTNGGVNNPGRGLVQWQESLATAVVTTSGDGSTCSQQPSVESYHRHRWVDLESGVMPGDYSAGFATLDTELVNANTRGGRCIWGFYCLFGAHGSLLPAYIATDATYNAYRLSWSGTNDTIVPDWNNTAFLARMQALIAAMGNRYDGNPNLGAIEITLYGHFGEFHMIGFASVGPNGQLPITDANKRQIVDWFYQYFPRTRILITTTENMAATYAFGKTPLVPSGIFRQSGGDTSWANLDQDNASSGSGGLHDGCNLAEWTNVSHSSIRSFVLFNDQNHLYNGAPYNLKATIQGTGFQYIKLGYRQSSLYPQQAIDVGTSNPYGATHLRLVMRGEGTGVSGDSERPTVKMFLIGQGGLAKGTLSGSGLASATLVDAGLGVGGVGYQSPSITVKGVNSIGSSATFPALTVTSGVIQALPSPNAPGSAYIAAPDIQIIDGGAAAANPGLAAVPGHNEAGGSVSRRPITTGWTIYDIPLSTMLSTQQAAHNYCNAVSVEFGAGTTTDQDIYYIGQWGLCTGAGTPLVYTFYDGSVPGLPGAWNSTVKNLWKTAPTHMEPFGVTTVLDNTTSGCNGQINTYHVATMANGNVRSGGYSTATTQQKSDWDNVNSGASFGSSTLYSCAGYQFQFESIAAPPKVYAGLGWPLISYWTNLGAAPCYDGMVVTWQLLDGATVVYSKQSKASLLGLAPQAGTSPATFTYILDELIIPSATPAHTLTLQMVVTHPVITGFLLTFSSLLTLTSF